MNKTIRIVLLLFIIVLFFISCGQNSKNDSSSSKIPTGALTESDSGSKETLHVGDTVAIALQENGDGGYVWEVEPGAESILEQQGLQTVPTSDAVGAPVIAIFTFKAIAQGNGTLKLIEHRPWETNVPPLATFELTVEITN